MLVENKVLAEFAELIRENKKVLLRSCLSKIALS